MNVNDQRTRLEAILAGFDNPDVDRSENLRNYHELDLMLNHLTLAWKLYPGLKLEKTPESPFAFKWPANYIV